MLQNSSLFAASQFLEIFPPRERGRGILPPGPECQRHIARLNIRGPYWLK